MVTLDFTLTPEASGRVHDALTCLSRFSDSVSLEARREKLTLVALNSSKSAYAAFSLDSNGFFSEYDFVPESGADGRFTCQILIKALLSVFKRRLFDTGGRETGIERCEVSVQDQPDQTECRLIVKMVCSHGVTKTYKLTYEVVEVMHALFDKHNSRNHWKISSGTLRSNIEYFGPKTEQLDMYYDDNRMVFTSFTEKIISHDREVLKQPLQTAISIPSDCFEEFRVQEKMHVTISVKDFKAIVSHAAMKNAHISAHYSRPTRPLQFSYGTDDYRCEFTLMTAGEYNVTAAPSVAHKVSSRSVSRNPSIPSERPNGATNGATSASQMPPPSRPNQREKPRSFGKNGRKPVAEDARDESPGLFVTQDEDDERTWQPPNFEDEEETLGWDASADNDAGFHPTFRDTATARAARQEAQGVEGFEGLAPTQRLSQIRGIW
ncbi:hypothetical protein K402DRAFT_206345 [Aulographum hederae CBS 113979]|uniref:DNA repair protein rad9 n=1 Tax=Aulographum hederae CBS 113979 TaxID=1176131 RepID=A0A6G1GNC8_9PEZI|nr:hypothetical protein K402DRAFT_206345 [Aulographum hederae CBS 113979]